MAINPAGPLFKQAGTSATNSITKPSLTVQGDLMFVVAFGTTAPTDPGGWSQVGPDLSFASGVTRLFMKVHGDEAGTTSYTFTNASVIHIITISGEDVDNPIGTVGAWETAASTTTPQNSGISFVQPETGEMAIAICIDGESGAPTYTAPTNYTERTDASSCTIDTRVLSAGTASTGAIQWTASASTNFRTLQLEVRASRRWRRFYLPSSGAPPISPAFDGSWTRTTEADRILAQDVRGSSAITSHTFRGSGANPNNALNRQFLIGPLAAQTVQGAIRMVARGSENATSANLRSQLVVRAVAPDGTTFRGTLLAAETSALSSEWNTSLRSVFFPKPNVTRNLTPTDVQEGDYLVVEAGGRYTSTSVATTDAISFGENTATALDETESDTGADHPWVDFPSGLLLQGEGALRRYVSPIRLRL